MSKKFNQVDEFTDSVEDTWGIAKEILLAILNNNIDKMEITQRKLWKIQALKKKKQKS